MFPPQKAKCVQKFTNRYFSDTISGTEENPEILVEYEANICQISSRKSLLSSLIPVSIKKIKNSQKLADDCSISELPAVSGDLNRRHFSFGSINDLQYDRNDRDGRDRWIEERVDGL